MRFPLNVHRLKRLVIAGVLFSALACLALGLWPYNARLSLWYQTVLQYTTALTLFRWTLTALALSCWPHLIKQMAKRVPQDEQWVAFWGAQRPRLLAWWLSGELIFACPTLLSLAGKTA